MYLLTAAFSRSTSLIFASEDNHAITSANSFSSSSLLFPSRASPSSLTSSTSQSYVPDIPRCESRLKYRRRIISWKSWIRIFVTPNYGGVGSKSSDLDVFVSVCRIFEAVVDFLILSPEFGYVRPYAFKRFFADYRSLEEFSYLVHL